MGVVEKESKLLQNVEVALEREVRQIKETQHRELAPGERDELRKKWEDSAQRIDSSGKLSEVWNAKPGTGQEKRHAFGYFGGVNFDPEGKIVWEN
jgi:hypothetical protein